MQSTVLSSGFKILNDDDTTKTIKINTWNADTVTIAGCSTIVVFGVILFGVIWYKLSKTTEASSSFTNFILQSLL